MKIALVLMVKDEVELLEAWLEYHSNLFGSDSIFLFDNGSTNIQSLQLLKSWEGRLGGVDYSYSSVQDYENKPHIYINKFRELEGLGFDCLFPMDCDEFIAVDIDGHVAIDKFSIFAELNKFVGSKHILRIKYALDNTPLVDFGFVKSHQKKCFFFNGVCNSSDHGFHDSTSFEFGLEYIATNIIYFHYHFRGYDDYVRSAKDKLSPWISSFDDAALLEYKSKKMPGHHLIDKILQGPLSYYSDQKSKIFKNKLIKVGDFEAFMVGRKLLINKYSDLINELDVVDWNFHIDELTFSDSKLKIRGWAYNSIGAEIKSIRLKINEYISDLLHFELSDRSDVVIVHTSALVKCGFSIEYKCELELQGKEIGLYFSSDLLTMGKYCVVANDYSV